MATMEAYKRPPAFATNPSASPSLYSMRSVSSGSFRKQNPTAVFKNFSPFGRRKKDRSSMVSMTPSYEADLANLHIRYSTIDLPDINAIPGLDDSPNIYKPRTCFPPVDSSSAEVTHTPLSKGADITRFLLDRNTDTPPSSTLKYAETPSSLASDIVNTCSSPSVSTIDTLQTPFSIKVDRPRSLPFETADQPISPSRHNVQGPCSPLFKAANQPPSPSPDTIYRPRTAAPITIDTCIPPSIPRLTPDLSTAQSLPDFPDLRSLPSTEDIEPFIVTLEEAIQSLKDERSSDARNLADTALNSLTLLADLAACVAEDWGEFWTMLVYAAKDLCKARPSMSAAISSCILRCLEGVAHEWNKVPMEGGEERNTTDMAEVTGGYLGGQLEARKRLGARPSENFAAWLRRYLDNKPESPRTSPSKATFEDPNSKRTVHLLTLSNSITIRSTILHVLEAVPDLIIHLTILESRPRCEGADMACQIIAGACDKSRLLIHIVPDCAVGTPSQTIDIVLLGADRIFATGDVRNKIGSLSAALCVKSTNKHAKVVIISDVDKIGAGGLDDVADPHPPTELTSAWSPDSRNELAGHYNVDVYSEWYEKVPARLIDAYVTEVGVLSQRDVESLALETVNLERAIFRS